MRLKSKSPFSPTVGANWLRFQTFRWPEWHGWYYGVIDGHALKVRQAPDGIQFRGDAPKKAVRRYFRLDEDMAEVHKVLSRKDPAMKWLVERYGDMRILRQYPWECLVSFICAQGVAIEGTARIVDKITQQYGEPRSLDGVPLHSFPSPQRLAGVTAGDLKRLDVGLSDRSAQLIVNIAKEGRDLDALSVLPYEEAKSQLLEWYGGKGIGQKTADCVCLFALGHDEAFPIDRHVADALLRHYGCKWSQYGKNVALREWVSDHFGQNAGYASQLLFHSEVL